MKIKQFITACGLVLTSHAVFAQVLISDGDLQVTVDEFSAAIEFILPEGQQEKVRADPQSAINFLSDYFVFKQMAREAEQQGLDKKNDVKVQLDYSRWRLLSKVLLEQQLAAAKEPDFTALAKEAYLVEKKRFSYPAQVHAAHILLEVNAQQDKATALAKANKIYAQVLEDKERFAELAKEYSDDPSAQSNSGDLGYFTRDVMVEPFASTAFSMKKGQISKPIKTDFGYHIIQVLDTKPATLQSFDEVKDELIAEQQKKFQSAERNQLVGKFRASPSLVLDEVALTEFLQQLK